VFLPTSVFKRSVRGRKNQYPAFRDPGEVKFNDHTEKITTKTPRRKSKFTKNCFLVFFP